MELKTIILSSLLLLSTSASAGDVVWFDGYRHVTYSIQKKTSPVVNVALNMFASDMKAVTGHKASHSGNGQIEVYQLNMLSNKEFKAVKDLNLPIDDIITKQDAFYIGIRNGNIVVMGSNGRGTAYGILELSRMAGVSPWIWWGDVKPERQKRLIINDNFSTIQSPSVEYRGIFINDEDWSLRRWAHAKLDRHLPEGAIGPRTYKKVFELLLRLRANTIWPAMHTGTTAFFKVKGNREVADSCDIVVGSSHCEPMLCNNVGEWNAKDRGDYNFITNRKSVEDYWAERIKETCNMDAIYTIGMRGIHDGYMEGVKTLGEQTNGLQMVIDDQRKMLAKYVNKDVNKIPQVFIPYKEVLKVYENGLRVPDDVTLMWCDDNYGYMTRLADKQQQKRSGGGGVYYHMSYWGRPHDYLWLTTMQPGLIYNEMHQAYNHNARRMWIANVHDPKVAAYDLSLFLDMAWDINSVKPDNIQQHLCNWLCQQFDTETGYRLLPAMTEFYRLTAIRKPEFMGWNQVELDKKNYNRGMSLTGDTEFNPLIFGNELERHLNQYEQVKSTISDIEKTIRPELKDAFFAAIKYPVFAAAAMATKQLQAQEARDLARKESFHNDAEALYPAVRSVKAYKEIKQLTDYYNNEMSNGKWHDNMCMEPRDLPVFSYPNLPDTLSNTELAKYSNQEPINSTLDQDGCIVRNACDFQNATTGAKPVQMLGHSMNAVALPKDGELTYTFNTVRNGDAVLRVALIPTQANDTGDIRFSVSVDSVGPTVYSIKEPERSEQWKMNVLRGQALRELKLTLSAGYHKLVIKALDEHIIIDQWMIDYNRERLFYVFPIK